MLGPRIKTLPLRNADFSDQIQSDGIKATVIGTNDAFRRRDGGPVLNQCNQRYQR